MTDDMRTVWAHPLNAELSVAREGDLINGLSVADEGALVITVADEVRIVMESPQDVLSILHEARHLLGDLILETANEED